MLNIKDSGAHNAAAAGPAATGPAAASRTGTPSQAACRAALAQARTERAEELDRMLAGLVADERDVALVAVGSHARRELTPGSDLDLVLLHRGRSDIAEVAERVWYPIWDAGLRLDHSVRTVHEARTVARSDLKAALGLLEPRRIAGDTALADEVRSAVLADWRADARARLAELAELSRERRRDQGELAFLLEPDLKEAHGGLRDVHVMRAVAAAWVAQAPGERVKAAHELILDVRHALHLATGRGGDRLVLQEQDAVARTLGLLDATALLRALAEAGRTVTFAAAHAWRQVDRFLTVRSAPAGAAGAAGAAGLAGSGQVQRRPLADGVVEHDGEVVLARGADVRGDPALILRAAAAAAQAGLPLAPATVDAFAKEIAAAPLPVPWPAEARDALVALLGAGEAAIGVWEALDQAGVIVDLLPGWDRVRNRPQRNPVHTYTVDRHLVETAAHAARLTREVARPDLLLICALLHDIGKGWPGDHSRGGAPIARDLAVMMGFRPRDVEVIEKVVRHHLLLPDTATRRDLDDPVTVQTVVDAVGDHLVLELLAALAVADGLATGPAAWGAWKAGLIEDLVRRADAALAGATVPQAPPLRPERLALARHDGGAVRISGSQVTIVAPDRPGLLWRAAGVLALHRLIVRTARTVSTPDGRTALLEFTAVPEFGTPPDPAALEADLRRMLADRLDVAGRLEQRARAAASRPGAAAPPPRVSIVDDASHTATVVEVRAHDRPGLLWRIGQALGACGLHVRGARVDTLGADAVDVFYVVDESGKPLAGVEDLSRVRERVLGALG